MDYKKLIIKEIIIGLALIIFFSVMIALLSFDINKRAANFAHTKQQIDSSIAAIGSLAYLQSDAEAAKKYLPQMSSYLIGKDRLVNFPKDMNIIAQQNKMNFSVVFGTETPLTATDPGSTAIAISSASQTTLGNFINFLVLLENSRYFVKFSSLDINQDANQLKATLNGSIFSF